MKKYWLFYGLVSLMLLSGTAFADDIGTGTGWCQPTNGAHVYSKDITSTINYDANDPTNRVKEIHWSSSGSYTATCDCSNSNYRGNNYFSADTGSLTTRGTHSDARSSGYTMYYYELVPGKLEVGTEAYVAGGIHQNVPVPFSDLSNKDSSAGGCGSATMGGMTAGSQGNVRIYVAAPLTGQIIIPSTKIMDMYLSKTNNATATPAVPHVAEFWISGTITVPQSCTINAGQTIEVKFPELRASDIHLKGASPDSAEQTTRVSFTCSNVADGSDISIAITGESDPHERDYLKTTHSAIGIKITDTAGNVITPDGKTALPVKDYDSSTGGSSTFKSRPVNTSGNAPDAGTYEAIATLTIKIQ